MMTVHIRMRQAGGTGFILWTAIVRSTVKISIKQVKYVFVLKLAFVDFFDLCIFIDLT